MLSHDTIWELIDRLAHQQGLTPSGLARLAGLDSTTFNPSKRHKADGRPRWPSTESIAKILDATQTAPNSFFAVRKGLFTQPAEHHPSSSGFHDEAPKTQQSSTGNHGQRIQKSTGLLQRLKELAEVPDHAQTVSPSYRQKGTNDKKQACRKSNHLPCSGGKATSRWETKSAIPAPISSSDADSDTQDDEDFILFPALDSQRVLAFEVEDDTFLPCYRQGSYLLMHPLSPIRSGDRILLCAQEQAPMIAQVQEQDGASVEIERQNLPNGRDRILRDHLIWWARILWASQ